MSTKYNERSLAATIEMHEANFREAYGQNVHIEMLEALHSNMGNLIKHLKKEQPDLLKHASIGSTGLLTKVLKQYTMCRKASDMKLLRESIDRIMKQNNMSSFQMTATTAKSRVQSGEEGESSHHAARGAAFTDPSKVGDKMGKGGSKDVQPKVGGGSKAIASGGSAAPAKIGPPKTVKNDGAHSGASTSAKATAGAARQEQHVVGSQKDSPGKTTSKGPAALKVSNETQSQSVARPRPKPRPKPKATTSTPAPPATALSKKGDEEDVKPPKKKQRKIVVAEVIKDSSDDDHPLPPARKKAGKRGVKSLQSEGSDVEIVSGPSTGKASKARKMSPITVRKEKVAVHAESSKAAGKQKRAVTEDEESEGEESGRENEKDEEEDDLKSGQCPKIQLAGRKAEERVQELAQYGRPQHCEYCRVNNLDCDVRLPSNLKFKIGNDRIIGLSCQECKLHRDKRRCIWFGLPAAILQEDAKFSMAAIRSVRQDNEPVKVVIAEKGAQAVAALERRLIKLEAAQKTQHDEWRNAVSKIETNVKNLQAKVNLALKDAKNDKQMHAANIKSLGTKVENVKLNVKALKDKEPMTFTQDDFDMVKATADLALAGYQENKQWLTSMNKLFETIVQAQERKEKEDEQRAEDVRRDAASHAAHTPDPDAAMSFDDDGESVDGGTMGAMFDDNEDIAQQPHNGHEELNRDTLGSVFDDDNAGEKQAEFGEDGLGNIFEDDDWENEASGGTHGGASGGIRPRHDPHVNDHETSDMELSESEYVPPPPHDGQYSSELETSSGSNQTEAVTTVTEESETEGHQHQDSSNAGSIIPPPANPLQRSSSRIAAAHNAFSHNAAAPHTAREPSEPPVAETAPTNASTASSPQLTNEDVDSMTVLPPLQPLPQSPPVPIEEMVNFGDDD